MAARNVPTHKLQAASSKAHRPSEACKGVLSDAFPTQACKVTYKFIKTLLSFSQLAQQGIPQDCALGLLTWHVGVRARGYLHAWA